MTSTATTVDQYINEAPEDRREALKKIKKCNFRESSRRFSRMY